MWYGKNTEELMKLKVQYEDLFGYNPDGEMDLEYDENSYNEYVHDLKEAIREKKELADFVEKIPPILRSEWYFCTHFGGDPVISELSVNSK